MKLKKMSAKDIKQQIQKIQTNIEGRMYGHQRITFLFQSDVNLLQQTYGEYLGTAKARHQDYLKEFSTFDNDVRKYFEQLVGLESPLYCFSTINLAIGKISELVSFVEAIESAPAEEKVTKASYNKLLREKEDAEKAEIIKMPSKNIFVVHGREHEPMKELKNMLIEHDFNPIVLHEQASGGSATLAEKLEKYSGDIGYAFIILTPEDVGCHRETIRKKYKADQILRTLAVVGKNVIDDILKDFEPRARQNVIFEMGYFWGLLKRKRVCCLIKRKVKKPSDIDGIVYVPFDESISEAKNMILKELREAGYQIKPKNTRNNS